MLRLKLLTLSALTALGASAVPARPGLTTVTQPDGTTVEVMLCGDEFSHYYLTSDSLLLMRDNVTDAFHYAIAGPDGMPVASGQLAADPSRRSNIKIKLPDRTATMSMIAGIERSGEMRRQRARRNGPGLFPNCSFPSTGHQKALVILVEYQDVKFTVDDASDYFTRMLTQKGFNDNGATGSALDWYIEGSDGHFVPEFDVYGPLTLKYSRSYYGKNDYYGNDASAYEMAVEACQQLDATVDFNDYDRDGDGVIDNVYVFYAGMGENISGVTANAVWPHAYYVTAATDVAYRFDGVLLDHYACSNEWQGDRVEGIGTFVHEFSHVMGLPDLYATNNANVFDPGRWSVMSYGPYNNDGLTPPLYTAFERYAFGWFNPREVTGAASVTLDVTSRNSKPMIVNTSNPNEYYLFENRQQRKWDEYIPYHGMLVWHIDYSDYEWTSNTVNNINSHQRVDIVEADGMRSSATVNGDPFPGVSQVTSFTDNTSPSMKTWNGTALNLPLTDITESTDGIITFDVAGGGQIPAVAELNEAADVTSSSARISWNAVNGAVGYRLTVYSLRDYFGYDIRMYVDGLDDKPIGNVTEVDLTGLTPQTKYWYTVTALGNTFEGNPAAELSFETLPPTLDYYSAEVADATDVTETSFTANWLTLDGAEAYLLTVCTKEMGDPEIVTIDFTGGLQELPEGWSTDSRNTYSNPVYSGEAAPSLRLSGDGSYIESCLFEDDLRNWSFWMRGAASSEDNSVVLMGLAGDKWTEIETFEINSESGQTYSGEFASGYRAMKLVFKRSGSGAVAIDDLRIGWGGFANETYVGDLKDFNAGNALTHKIEGLVPGTTYYYSIVATDGKYSSQRSREIRVTTLGDAAINTIDASVDAAPEYFNLQGMRITSPRSGQTVIVRRGDRIDKIIAR